MASKGPKPEASAQAAKPIAKPAVKADAAPAVAKASPVKASVAPKPVAKTAPAIPPALAAPSVKAEAAPAPAARVAEPVQAEAPAATPAISTPAAADAAPLHKETDIMATTFQSAADTAQAAAHTAETEAKTLFGDVNDRAKSALAKGSKAIEEMNEFSKGNVEALMESTKIAAKGAEDIAKYTTEYVKATVEKANATAKQFAAVKSPTELFKLQSEHAKEAMDAVMAETAKFTENYLKLLGEIAQPISNRVALAAEKLKIAA